jgi:DNA-binding response OmpR family regulator
MNKVSVLIVEDDEVTALNMQMSLEKQGYDVVSIADTVLKAQSKIKIYHPSIIIIDISLQSSNDGIELANYINRNAQLPFIFLTSHSNNDVIDLAKKSAPYGYIVKPFNPINLHTAIQIAMEKFELENQKNRDIDELISNKDSLEKLLYNKKSSTKPIVPFGEDYHLDISICETFYKNEKIKLTKKENAFIRLLVSQLGVVVSFDQAVNYVWSDEGATENSVRTLVWRLRSKLPTKVINNASGIGYYISTT